MTPRILWYAGMMAGSARAALRGARGMNAMLPRAMLDEMPAMGDAVVDAPLVAMARFGMWDDALAEPLVEPRFRLACVVGRAVRGMARVAKGDHDGAARELAEAERATEAIAPYALFGNASLARDVAAVATRLLAGEIAALAGDVDGAASAFAEAERAEDRLFYDEPPDWALPARQIAGAVLLAAGRTDDALRAFADDLAKNPENGWSLFGTWKALDARGSPDAAAARARFERAWSRADVALDGVSSAGFVVRPAR